MKKLFSLWVLLLSFTLGFVGCQDEYDDTELRKDVTAIQGEIEAIKADLATLKAQVNSIQTLVDAHKDGKVVTQIEDLGEGKGYRLTFNDATTIEVLKYVGEQPKKGTVMGVQEEEGVFYWTVVTDGNASFLLDDQGAKVPVSGAKAVLTLDEEGYWTLDGKRIVDANEDFIRFKKGDSSALFKDIVVAEDKVTFILNNGAELVVNKKTESFLRFAKTMEVVRKNRPNKLKFDFSADIHDLAVTKAPEGWSTHIHWANKYVNVTVPSDAPFSLNEIRIEGLDANGMVYAAVVKVAVKGTGFDDKNGVFVLNEGNMTTENGSLIYIDGKGVVSDFVYQAMNGSALGNVTQDLFINNNKMYIIAQNGKTNAVGTPFKNDGMLVIANSKTLVKQEAFTDELASLSWPTHLAVVDDNHVYIRDNKGVHRFDPSTKELTFVNGTSGAQKTRMAVASGKVYVSLGSKLAVIDKGAVTKTIDMPANITGVIKAADGNIFVSTEDRRARTSQISKYNSQTGELIKTNQITLGSAGNGGMAATPGITAIGDILYYGGLGTKIYRHNFETGECKLMIDAKTVVPNSNMVYNTIGVHPVTGYVYMNTIKGYGFDYLTNNISVFKPEGDVLVLEENYEDHTHFPAGFFFPAYFQ